MLLLAQKATTPRDARVKLEASIASGAALEKFRAMIAAQGGDAAVVDDPARLPQAKFKISVPAPITGLVHDVDPMTTALAVLRLGGGRANADARIDHAVGIDRLLKIGEPVEAGAPLGVIHANDEASGAEARAMVAKAIVVGREPRMEPELIGEVIG